MGGTCEVLDASEGEEVLDGFVESLLRITPTRWGTVSTGGFPPEAAERS